MRNQTGIQVSGKLSNGDPARVIVSTAHAADAIVDFLRIADYPTRIKMLEALAEHLDYRDSLTLLGFLQHHTSAQPGRELRHIA